MTSKQGVPQDHDINKLIAEQKFEEAKKKNEVELKRQRELVNKDLWPYLLINDRKITEAKQLLSKTKKALQTAYEQKMKEEQTRLSSSTLDELDVDERLERSKEYEAERSVLNRLGQEKVGTAMAILEALEVVILAKEAEENSKRPLSELKIKL